MRVAELNNLTLKQYFTDAEELNKAMGHLLGCVENKLLLEPSVGSGSLLTSLRGTPRRIDAVDVDPSVLEIAKNRYPNHFIETHCVDFVDAHISTLFQNKFYDNNIQYDAVIANPPFGLYFSNDYRRLLKSRFPSMYVRESYGLFFIISIERLITDGRFVFLVPDTFLTSKNHSSLRRFICDHVTLDHVIRFPSKRFESVNFGYGNLCIIAGRKRPLSSNAKVSWIEAFDPSSNILEQPFENCLEFSGSDLLQNQETGWQKAMADEPVAHSDWTCLGDIAECKTGIYSGDNERFIGYDAARIKKRLNGHSIDWASAVISRDLTDRERENGLENKDSYVALIRGGHREFNDQTPWAIRWDLEALHFYRNNKKARLQNSKFYFRPGIAVPMVTARRLSASLMERAVFDQGVVGVFPLYQEQRNAILLYLNSRIATDLRNNIVNGGANNSANYLKRLPVPKFSKDDIRTADDLMNVAFEKNLLDQKMCDEFIFSVTNRDKK